MPAPLTHPQLVAAAARWLRDERRCFPVLTEPDGQFEVPDAIGWENDRVTHVVDCKTSEADYRNDLFKPFRKAGTMGMGVYRWYLCEPGVLEVFNAEEHGWGLLHIEHENVRIVQEAQPWCSWNRTAETGLLRTVQRNLQKIAGRSPDDSRPSTRSSLTREQREAIKELIATNGTMRLAAAARKVFGKSSTKFRNQIDSAVRAGEIEGVTATAELPTTLIAAKE